MNHSFNVEIATKFGILEAILIENIRFWTAKNQANGTHYYDGYYWVYNSARAFAELFPYASENKIRNALKRLVEAGILQTGNYNKMPTDRTLWYAFTDLGISILQNQQIDLSKMQNGFCKNDTTIPIINPIINQPVIIPDNNKQDEFFHGDTELNKAFCDWLQYKKERRESYKPTGLKALVTTLKREVDNRGKQAVIDGIYTSMGNGWRGIYFSSDNSKPKQARPIERDPDLDAIF